ncbi:MAG: anaerobic ribonucleoside-triphosphate reductase activating protein [Paraprevotella sp.]|nr:anaerobic ribonucleoside-triphosphate reductase activating protein [Paraprevotella sp.]
MTINVLNILHDTTVDGPGFRTSIYCAGCRHQCAQCHNPQSWTFGSGTDMSTEDILQEIISDPFADVTFTGGDPLYQAEAFAELAKLIKTHTKKSIWCYTGFTFEQLIKREECRELLLNIDVLVDGPFIASKRSEEALFRGSTNQRILLSRESIIAGKPILWKEPNWDV